MVMGQDIFRGKMGADVKISKSTKLLDMQQLCLQLRFVMPSFVLQDTYTEPLPALVGTGIFALDLNMTLGSCQLLVTNTSSLIYKNVDIHNVSSNNIVIQTVDLRSSKSNNEDIVPKKSFLNNHFLSILKFLFSQKQTAWFFDNSKTIINLTDITVFKHWSVQNSP